MQYEAQCVFSHHMSMARHIEVSSNTEVYSDVQFLWNPKIKNLNYNHSEIHHQIVMVYGENALSCPMITKSYQMFENRGMNVNKQTAPYGPSAVNTTNSAKHVNEMIQTNHCITKLERLQVN